MINNKKKFYRNFHVHALVVADNFCDDFELGLLLLSLACCLIMRNPVKVHAILVTLRLEASIHYYLVVPIGVSKCSIGTSKNYSAAGIVHFADDAVTSCSEQNP